MINLSIPFQIEVDFRRAWAALSDPAFVASCMPGAEISEGDSEGVHGGKIRFQFGPTVAVFTGEVKLAYDHTAHTCAIEGSGVDHKGSSKAFAEFNLKAMPSEKGTDVELSGGFDVSGPLAMFARAGGEHVARVLAMEFAENMARAIAGKGEAQAAQTPLTARPRANAPSTWTTLRIVLKAMLAWLRGLALRR